MRDLAHPDFDMSRVAVKFAHDDNIARNILEEARGGHYDTIVVRQGISRSNRSSWRHNRYILRDAKGFAIWVVE